MVRRGGTLRIGTLCLAALAACATPRLPSMAPEAPLAEDGAGPALRFSLRYMPEDRSEAARIRGAILEAAPRVSRWGAFRQGVTVRILPDHEALEAAVGRHGYAWLRAWAFGDQILLQSPRSWDGPHAAVQEEMTELLAHELTPALMYPRLPPVDGGVRE